MADTTGRARAVAAATIVAAVAFARVPPSAFAHSGLANQIGAQALNAGTIRDEQNAVVNHNDQIPIQAAERLARQLQSSIAQDRQAISSDTDAGSTAGAAHQGAIVRLSEDTEALAKAGLIQEAAQGQVDGDRARLRALAVGTYTGEFTNPQPSGSPTPQADQQAAIDVAEVKVVAGIVNRRMRVDVSSLIADTMQRERLSSAVSTDQQTISATTDEATAAADRVRADNSALASDRRGLSIAEQGLGQAQAKLAADLISLAGPSSTSGGAVSILGGSALTPAQLAAWYRWDGYANLTPAPIEQLAAWYIEYGAQEGVRGDVAFAQAMLETGGFTSPDATDFNNYAGIGHCDSCASGWQFPSPSGGVLGQLQLLRIFATTAPPPRGAPPPVLPSLTVSNQHEAGCCPSVESLTGVWATDPTYGTQILSIYQQMLEYVLSQR